LQFVYDHFQYPSQTSTPEGRLTPGALGDLRSGYEELATPAKEARTKSITLERRLTDLVNHAYGLTEEEIHLMWSTAPPRMPGFRG
jgi:hypothetical protein